MSVNTVVKDEPIIPDFEKTELIGWHLEAELKSRSKENSDSNTLKELLRNKALDAENAMIKATGVNDFWELDNSAVFRSSFWAVRVDKPVGYVESLTHWREYFSTKKLNDEFMNWLTYRWVSPTISYYRWVEAGDYKRGGKMPGKACAESMASIDSNSMTSDIDEYWKGDFNLTLFEKKCFNILIDLGIGTDTKVLIKLLPDSVLRIYEEVLHNSLAFELANNPNVTFRPRFALRNGNSIYFWSGVGRIPVSLKDKTRNLGELEAIIDNELMREWRRRTELKTTVHSEQFVEIHI